MKKFLYPLSLVGLAFLVSCGGDDPLPSPVVSFITDPGVVEVGVPVKFENQSLKASSYLWDFGGGVTSEEISPTVTFDSRGELYVKLTANTDDGQMVTDSILVSVKERVLTGYFVNIYPTTNGTAAWDPTEDGEAQFADILIQLIADQATSADNSLLDGIFTDVGLSSFSLTVDPAFDKVTFTDEVWVFSMFDFDGADGEAPSEGNTEFMSLAPFNPLEAPTFKNEDGDAGYFSVFYQDDDTGFVMDLDFTFVIE